MQLIQFRGRVGMVVMDGDRAIAKARYCTGPKVWLVKAYGFEWLGAEAARPNVLDIVDRRFLRFRTKNQAQRQLRQLMKTGRQ